MIHSKKISQQQSGSYFISIFQLVIAAALVTICILYLDSVEGACLNCEAPYGPYCCKTSFRGQCCEYPLDDRAARNYANLSPLERQIKSKGETIPFRVEPESRTKPFRVEPESRTGVTRPLTLDRP